MATILIKKKKYSSPRLLYWITEQLAPLNERVMGSRPQREQYEEVYRLLSYMLEAFDFEVVIKRRTKAD